MDALLGAAACGSSAGGSPLGNLADGLTDRDRVAEQLGAGMVHSGAAARPNAAAAGRTMAGEGAAALGMFAALPEPEPEVVLRARATWQDRWVRKHKPELTQIDVKRPLSALDLSASIRPSHADLSDDGPMGAMREAHRSSLALMGRGEGLFRSHPTLMRTGDRICKRPGSAKGWATAVLPEVMRVEPGGRRHFLDVQVGANNQLMVGVCRTRFDPVHGDNQLMSGVGGTGYLGAAFGENGWACKCIEPP